MLCVLDKQLVASTYSKKKQILVNNLEAQFYRMAALTCLSAICLC